ncbi:MAG: type IV secretory system conjugative DNA transfer family protein [Lachnospiraceae bacterium]|nr:type IV secretory system conjugative DNA transfer family protein [Lachnospiraceae bacterium]
MYRSRNIRMIATMYGFLAIFVVWVALLLAPYVATRDLLLANAADALSHPLRISLCKNTPRCVLIFLLVYGLAVLTYETNRKNYRRKEEHGSAKWGDPRALRRELAVKTYAENRLLTANVRMGYDGHVHQRNLNTLVIGGAGSGKSRYYVKPNLMQGNTSYVVLDPKGELLRDVGGLLVKRGYRLRVLDLHDMEKSHGYNPFVYLRNDTDIQQLVTNIFKSTAPREAVTQDPFWDNAAAMLLKALIFYLHYEAPPEEQNFAMIMEMIRYGEVRDGDEEYRSALDLLFDELAAREPFHPAVKAYRNYRSGAADTLKSIQITLISRLEKFDLDAMAKLTMTDELDLPRMGSEKTALFAVIPDDDTSFNFLVTILYMQLFQELYEQADRVYGGRLPVPVHFLMDEFANVALPNDFDKLLATMRSREISVSIIIQNAAQLKALFKDSWESIRGNCDEFLYLGGNEFSTHKMISEMLDKETIDTNTYGRSHGRNGSYSTNDQNSGRELLTPGEVSLLPKTHAILFVKGARPILDQKYPLLRHPNIKDTVDGGAPPYRHGVCPVGQTLSLPKESTVAAGDLPELMPNPHYELLADEEIEAFYAA